MQEWIEFENNLKDIDLNKYDSIVIFGCGLTGEYVYDILKNLHKKFYFCDNNIESIKNGII